MGNLWVRARIELIKGADLAQACAGLDDLVGHTVKEPGCILFEVRQDLETPQRFTLWECWTDDAALTAHFDAVHTHEYLAKNLTSVLYVEKLGPIQTDKAQTMVGVG